MPSGTVSPVFQAETMAKRRAGSLCLGGNDGINVSRCVGVTEALLKCSVPRWKKKRARAETKTMVDDAAVCMRV